MLSNMKVGTKLLAVAAAPLLLALLLTFVGINDRRADAASAADTEHLVGFSNRTTALVDSLQSERTATVDRISGAADAQLDALREETDADAAAFNAGRTGLPADRELTLAIDEAVTALEGVSGMRERVDGSTADAAIVAEYTQVVERLFEVQREVAEQPALGDATNDVLSLLQISEAKEMGAAIEAQTALAFSDGAADPTVAPAVAAELGALESARTEAADRLLQLPSDEATDLTAQAFSEWSQSDELENLMTIFVATTNTGTVGDSDRTRLDAAIEGYTSALREAEISVAEATQERAADAASSASANARNFMVIWLIAAIGSVVLAVVLAKALTRRLVRLTEAADDLAERQLPNLVEQLRTPPEEGSDEQVDRPDPVDVHGSDEIGQLADSFNTVQTVAYDVAIEQGKMLEKGISEIFVNLARRNQALIDRQIQFIDELERHEEDPDVLESLFRLDHLATRMRRHAESLLVLAGAEPSRRRSAPVSLSDVVRVAVGEIEDYNRISLVAFDDAEVPSGVAVDVAHMMSELMENATQFSPPDTVVEIVGHRTHEGYTVSISDQGIGMSAEQLDDVNELLASPPATGLTLNRTLGFVVIARLARRFAIKVRLTSSPSGGVTAIVNLPEAVLVGGDAENAEEPSEEGSARIIIPEAGPTVASTTVVAEVEEDAGIAAPLSSEAPEQDDAETIMLDELPSRPGAPIAPTGSDQELPPATMTEDEPAAAEPAPDLDLPAPFPVAETTSSDDVDVPAPAALDQPAPFAAPEPDEIDEPVAIDEPEPFEAPEPVAIDEPEPFEIPEPVAIDEPEPFEIPEPVAIDEPEPFEIPEPVAIDEPEPFEIPEPVAIDEPEPFEIPEPVAIDEPEPFEIPEPVAIDEPEPFEIPEPVAIDEPEPFEAPEPFTPAFEDLEPEPYAPLTPAPEGAPEPFEPSAPAPPAAPEPEVQSEPEPLTPFAPAASAEPEAPLEPRLPPPPAEPLTPFAPAQDHTPLPTFHPPAAPTEEPNADDWGSGSPLTSPQPVGDLSQPTDGFLGLPSRVSSTSDEPPGPPPPLDTPSPGFAPSGSGQTTPGGLPLWQPTFVPAPADAGANDLTPAGLTRRERTTAERALPTGPSVTSTRRSPEEVRQMLSRYRGGLKKGRAAPAEDGTTTHESSPSS